MSHDCKNFKFKKKKMEKNYINKRENKNDYINQKKMDKKIGN